MSLLSVEDLRTTFETKEGTLTAVDGVNFEIDSGETLGLVGESGSGKSVTAQSVMRLIQQPGQITSGEIEFDGRDLRNISETELRRIRNQELSMIFQEPQESLNPVFTIGEQIAETLQVYGYEKGDPWDRAVELLGTVGLPNPEEQAKKYPHQYSGGMAQRAMIAIAIAGNPKLLIADEPTTALDVTIEAQILELLDELKAELDMSMLFISHDLGTIWNVCDRVAVMYMGKIVEIGEVESLFQDPQHPYTEGLLECLPGVDGAMEPIPGSVPSNFDLPSGCTFHPRCPYVTEGCTKAYPATESVNGHEVACYRHTNVTADGQVNEGKLPTETSESTNHGNEGIKYD
jgi:oligopeptide/dipeptide ABC transporter ATP-binding protein